MAGKTEQQSVFLYVDNSNVFIEAQRLAPLRNGGDPSLRYRVRIDYDALVRLCCADRPLYRALVAGSVPPELENLWRRLENRGVQVHMFKRAAGTGEQQVPDLYIMSAMWRDALKHRPPGIAVLVTGDGAGFENDEGMGAALRDMHDRGWKVEVLSWAHCVNRHMREWAQKNGKFLALDDFYESVTFLEPRLDGDMGARHPTPIDFAKRGL